jgi:DNA mismatch repair protein MutS
MEVDKITYADLAVFNKEEEFSIFQKLNFTRTSGGRDWLFRLLNQPFSDVKPIMETQQIISLIMQHEDRWPASISNGTIMVMEKFYETSIDDIPAHHDLFNAFAYQFFHKADFSLVRYSMSHFADFIRGMNATIALLENDRSPDLLRGFLKRAQSLLNNDVIRSLGDTGKSEKLRPLQVAYYGNYVRERFKLSALELIDIYGRLDAWYSMAMATKKYKLTLPVFTETPKPCIRSKSLYHILLPDPVAYDVELDQQNNFLFLTGANMAGKSTFIKAVGIAVFMAHVGMGVAATQMQLGLFDGILSNINIEDNISKGESYFYNEVQRVKNTILKINDNGRWLVLIDELFKGTNVQDAMKCSSTVIKGLIKIQHSLFILSTHLYEIGEELKQYPNITFKYFETAVQDDQLDFNYQLKDGISNDRLGYLILKREKVVELLEKL